MSDKKVIITGLIIASIIYSVGYITSVVLNNGWEFGASVGSGLLMVCASIFVALPKSEKEKIEKYLASDDKIIMKKD